MWLVLTAQVPILTLYSRYQIHKFDNKFGGSAVEDGIINLGQWWGSGRFWATEECDETTEGHKMSTGIPLVGKIDVVKDILGIFIKAPVYDEKIMHCNKQGLTELGAYLINRMIDYGMMIELDHMSVKTADAVLKIAEARGFSGLISSHTWMQRAKDGSVKHRDIYRLAKAGGYIGAYINDIELMVPYYLDDFLSVQEGTSFLHAVGASTDMAGLGPMAAAPRDSDRNPVQYPYTTDFNTTVHRNKAGTRTFDINTEGMAQYGLLPDYIQDIKIHDKTGRIYESVMNSAEAYLQMWERSTDGKAQATAHFYP